jgi:hypothetical protein
MEVDDLVWKERYEEEKHKRERAEKHLAEFKESAESIGKLHLAREDKIAELQVELRDQQLVMADLEAKAKVTEKFRVFDEALTGLIKDKLATVLPTSIPDQIGLQHATTIIDVAPVEKSIVINTDTIPGKILAVAKKGKLDSWCQLGAVVKAVEEERWTVTSQQINNALNDLVKEGLIAKRHTDRNYFCLAQGVKFKEQ